MVLSVPRAAAGGMDGAGQVLMHDLEAVIALVGHLLVFQTLDDEARQEYHSYIIMTICG